MVRGNSEVVNLRQARVDAASGQRVKRRKRADPRYVALRLLAIRPRSIRELTTRLKKKGFSDVQVESVVRELVEQGLLNDTHFARALTEQTVARKPAGRKLLAWKLQRANVAPDIVEEALANVLPHKQELLLARAAASRKLAELVRRRPDAPQREIDARLGRFLLSRGFSYDIIQQILEKS